MRPFPSIFSLPIAAALLGGLGAQASSLGEESLVEEFYASVPADWSETVAPAVADSFVTVLQLDFDGELLATGSGAILDDGLVVTCFHTIGEGRPLELHLPDGSVVAPTEIVSFDPISDIAILRYAEGAAASGLSLSLDSPLIGQPVAAMGNPGGDPGLFVTGVIAGEPITVAGQEVLPLSMAIEQGNSGGPVVDVTGKLVGIVSLKDLRRPGIGYAIPATEIQRLLEETDDVSFDEWMTRNCLPADRWSPDWVSDWSGRGSRVHVQRSSERGLPFRFCRAVGEPVDALASGELPEERARVVSVEVEVSPGRISGIAFGDANEDSYYAWSVRGDQSLVFGRVDRIAGTVESLERFPFPAHLGGATMVPLAIEYDGQRVMGFAGGIECGSLALSDLDGSIDDFWGGLSLSLGTEASFQNYVECVAAPGKIGLGGEFAEDQQKIQFLEEQLQRMRREAQQKRQAQIR
ncbi:MAG: S1C family serine protease, partial [Verrucomicrobiota bacterium]